MLPIDLIARHMPRGALSDSADPTAQNDDKAMFLRALRRQSRFLSMPFTVGTDPILLRDVEDRTYFILLNTSAAASIFIGFDFQPTSTNGVVLTAGGAYEPYQVPTNAIWVQASAAGATGTLIYSVGN